MTKLNTPVGVSEVNHGAESYAVADGQIEVPDDVAASLLKSHHGFSRVPSEAEVKDKALRQKK